jgi:hypothetical protein
MVLQTSDTDKRMRRHSMGSATMTDRDEVGHEVGDLDEAVT